MTHNNRCWNDLTATKPTYDHSTADYCILFVN